MIAALSNGCLEQAAVDEPERLLLEFVHKMTLHSASIVAGDTQCLRDAGWTNAQVAEAVYIAAMFAFFNRVADAFGLQDPQYFQHGMGGRQAD